MHTSQFIDLSGSGSKVEVRDQLFGTDWFESWKLGKYGLTLFIDSVDQAGIPPRKIVSVIANELGNADVGRLRLRLVCRDHDWSLSLADRLKRVWRTTDDEESNVRVYQLAPLDLEDIRFAVDANNTNIKDPEHFLKEIEDTGALPLATVPITLEMLLKAPGYRTSRRTELYEHGLRRLCRGTETTSVLTPPELERRFEMASRIAAVMMLSSKHAVDVEVDDVHESSSGLVVKDLLLDVVNESEESLIRATLDSALFQGTGKRTWAHQSFAENLAAEFLSNENIPVEKILERMLAPDQKFAPQLHDTLRWLVEMRSDVLSEVVKRQPTLLFTTDVSHLNEKEFRKLFTAVLNMPDPYVYSHETWNLRKFRAGHPSAKSVLLPYLTDSRHSRYLRRFVLQLLECLDINEIDDVLVKLALDNEEDQVLRQLVARRLQDVGSAEAKLCLKPYVYGRADDPDDELKGYAFRALWPDYLTADELFNALSTPKKENYLGSYKMFLVEGSIVDALQAADVPTALQWVAAQPSHHDMPFAFKDLPGKVMRKTWEFIQAPSVMEAFAETAVAMMTRFDGPFGESLYSRSQNKELEEFEKDFIKATDLRRELALMCLPHLQNKDRRASSLIRCWPSIVVADDLDWLLGILDSETSDALRRQLAELVASLLWHLSSQRTAQSERYRDIEKVYDAAERHPELLESTQRFFISMFDDEVVVSDREHHREMKEIEENQQRQLAEVQPMARLREALDLMESGETLQWLNVIYGLSHFPDGRTDPWNYYRPDLTDFPLWKSCDKETQERIVKAALSFVVDQDFVYAADNDEDWYETESVSYVELYGYFAIFLLRLADTNALDQFSAERWKRWTKVVVWYPNALSLDDGRNDYHRKTRMLQQDILHRLYQHAPQATLNNFENLIVATGRRSSIGGHILEKLEHLWNPAFEAMLLGSMQASSLSPKGQRSILDFLLARESDEALRVAEAIISRGTTNQNEKELVVEFAASLMTSETEFNWSAIWALFQNDDDIGQAIVEKVAEEDWHTARFANKLSAPELVDLFIWVEERYPSSNDPQVDGVHGVTTREQVGRWRNGIVSELRAKQSREALDGISRILIEFPKLEWLNFARRDLEKTVEG